VYCTDYWGIQQSLGLGLGLDERLIYIAASGGVNGSSQHKQVIARVTSASRWCSAEYLPDEILRSGEIHAARVDTFVASAAKTRAFLALVLHSYLLEDLERRHHLVLGLCMNFIWLLVYLLFLFLDIFSNSSTMHVQLSSLSSVLQRRRCSPYCAISSRRSWLCLFASTWFVHYNLIMYHVLDRGLSFLFTSI